MEGALAAPERSHDLERLVRSPPAAVEVDAHEPELLLVPAHPDPEPEFSPRDELQRRDLLRQLDRVVQGHEHDRRAEPDSLREARDPGESGERLVDPAIRLGGIGTNDDVLGRPHRVVSELLRELGGATDGVDARLLPIVGQDDAEMHDSTVVRSRVAASRVARLATIDRDGRPHLVPIVFVLDGNTLYSAVDAKPKRSRVLRRIENARREPNVTVLVDDYDDDWGRLWWVRLRGRARVLDEGAEAEKALDLLVAKYEQYREAPPGLPVLAIDVDEWRSWAAGP